MATYKHLRSSTANKRPTTSIADGQLAINTNTASPGLFFKDSAGTGIVKVGPVHVGTTAPNAVPASGGSTGNYTGEQWLDTSVSPAQLKVWNGSAWVGVVADELPVSKLQDGSARQLLQTDAAGTGVEWTSNVDVPGTLDVTSTATFDSIASHPLGSASAPTITFTGDTNTGFYSPGADQVAISTAGTGRLFVDANGNVGIGAVATSKFSVTGGSVEVTGPTYNYVQVQATGGAQGHFSSNASNSIELRVVTNHPLTFYTNNSERFRCDSSGRLLVGTSSSPPNDQGNASLFVVQGYVGAPAGPGIISLQRGEAATSITSNEEIGRISFNANSGNSFGWIQGVADATAGSGDYPGRLVFSTTADGAASPTERMRITSGGYFKASNSGSYDNVSGAFHELRNTAAALTLLASNTDSAGNGYQSNLASSGTAYYYFVGYSTSDAATKVIIYSNGNVQNANNSYGAISDIKLKENIVDANSQWDDIKALQVRKYNFKKGQTHTQIGLIAQEVELVSPGLVSESPDRDEDGNDLGTTTKSVNYSVLYMKAVKALQEAMERIEVLEQRLTDAGIA